MIRGFFASPAAMTILLAGQTRAVCENIPQVPDVESHRICSRGAGWCEMFLESDSHHFTCQWACARGGLRCIDGWKEDNGCGHDDHIGCGGSNDDSVCRCGGAPPTTVAPTTAAPTTVAPTTVAPTTSTPTTSSPTTSEPTAAPSPAPTAGPTMRPIVNLVTDCGAAHTNCTEEPGPLPPQLARCSTATPGVASAVCYCVGRYHCAHASARRGFCDTGDACLTQGVTAPPSATPTAAPTTAPTTSTPTASPTAAPTTSAPSLVPSAAPSAAPSTAPTGSPTISPSETYPRDLYGNPIFPTDPSGNEYLITSYWGDNIVPTDWYGNLVFPSTTAVTTTVAIGGIQDENGADRSTSKGDDSKSSSSWVVIVVAVILLLLTIVGAGMYVKKQLNGKPDGYAGSFVNELYDLNPAMPARDEAMYEDPQPGASRSTTHVNGTYATLGGNGAFQAGPVLQGAPTYMDIAADDLEESL